MEYQSTDQQSHAGSKIEKQGATIWHSVAQDYTENETWQVQFQFAMKKQRW